MAEASKKGDEDSEGDFAVDEKTQLLSLAEAGSIQLSKQVQDFRLFSDAYFNCSGEHFLQLQQPGEDTILHVAVKRGDYDIVVYLLESFATDSFLIRCLLMDDRFKNLPEDCVANTTLASDADVNNRKKILQLLTEIDEEFLRPDDFNNPLLCDKIHVTLIKSLLELGANLGDMRSRRIFFRKVCRYLTQEQLHDMVLFMCSWDFIDFKDNFESSCPCCTSLILHELVKFVSAETMMVMISMGIPLDVLEASGRSVLDCAIESGRGKDIVELLISNGMDINRVTPAGSLLHTAADYGNLEVLKYLITAGLDVNRKGVSWEEPPLKIALGGFSSDEVLPAVQVLLENGADVNYTDAWGDHILNCAVNEYCAPWHSNVIEIVKCLISHGADVNLGINIYRNWLFPMTRFMSPEELHDFVEYLITTGKASLLTQVTENNYCILHSIFERKEPLPKTLELFHRQGADFSVKDRKGRCLLLRAVRYRANKTLLAFMLSKFDFDKNSADNKGNGVFHLAVLHNNMDEVRFFACFVDCDINSKNKDGNTPLHLASNTVEGKHGERKYFEIFAELITFGADGAAKNKKQQTPYILAKENFSHPPHYVFSQRDALELLRREKVDGDAIFHAIEYLRFEEFKLACETCNRKGVKFNNLSPELEEFVKYLVTVNSSLLNAKDPSDHHQTCLNVLNGSRVNLPVIRFLIELGADPRIEDDFGYSALHYFASRLNEFEFHGVIEILAGKLLLEGIGSMVWFEIPVLHYAIYHNVHLLERTLDLWWLHGKDSIETPDLKGNTLLFAAVVAKKGINFLKMLISKFGMDCCHKNTNQETVLHLSVRTGYVSALEYFIKLGVNINSKDIGGRTPLHLAVEARWPATGICEILLENGANSSAVDNEGRTPLQLAVTCEKKFDWTISNRKLRVLRLLIEHGAKVDYTDGLGRSMMHYAGSLHPRVYNTLANYINTIGKGSCLSAVDKNGRNPIHCALLQGLRPLTLTLELFKNSGLDFNAKDFLGGNTILHVATRVMSKASDLLADLVRNGASCKIRNKAGQTCLHLSALYGGRDSMVYFLSHGAPVNSRDLEGSTPLHYAVRCQSELYLVKSKVELLIGFGADVWAMNRRGQFPMQLMEFPSDGESVNHDDNKK